MCGVASGSALLKVVETFDKLFREAPLLCRADSKLDMITAKDLPLRLVLGHSREGQAGNFFVVTIADAVKHIKGGGGKGADFAMAGGKDAAGIDAALDAARRAAGS